MHSMVSSLSMLASRCISAFVKGDHRANESPHCIDRNVLMQSTFKQHLLEQCQVRLPSSLISRAMAAAKVLSLSAELLCAQLDH